MRSHQNGQISLDSTAAVEGEGTVAVTEEAIGVARMGIHHTVRAAGEWYQRTLLRQHLILPRGRGRGF